MIQLIHVKLLKGNIMKWYRFRIYLIRIIYITFITIITAIVIFMGNGYMEYGVVKNEINNFKNRGEYIKTTYIQSQEVRLYQITPNYDYEVQNLTRTFDVEESLYIGSKGDIILSSSNPIKNYGSSLIKDIVGYMARRFYIGHATVNLTDSGDKIIESVGNDDLFYGVRVSDSKWIENTITAGTDELVLIGLKIKNFSNEDSETYVNNLLEQEGKKYNMNFLISKKNAYYCTDLITRIGNKSQLNLNYDMFFATGNDIIVSNDTFIFFVCERIENGKFNLYYLKGE